MTRKTVKNRSEDPFEKETGIRIYDMIGGSGCRITPMERTVFDGNQHRVKNIAASIYLDTPISELGKVEQTCDVKNCVHPAHITIDGKNLKLTQDGRVESPELEIDTPCTEGFFYGLHPSVWDELSEENKALARKGEYNPSLNGWLTK